MGGPGAFGDWLPLREVERLLNIGKSLLPVVPPSPAQILEAAIHTVAERVLNRRMRARVGESEFTMVPIEFTSRLETVGLATGQFAAIKLVAEDVTWPDLTISRLTIECHDVRLRSLTVPKLIVGSVNVTISVSGPEVRRRVLDLQPEVLVEIGDDSVIRAHWARMEKWGFIEFEPRVVRDTVYLDPTSLELAGRSLGLVRWIPPVSITVPDLPRGLQLTSVQVGESELILHGVTDRLRHKLSSIPLMELLSTLIAATTGDKPAAF